MITLHTWLPPPPESVIDGQVGPDMGHSSLEIRDDSGNERYVSYWPETDTLLGRLLHPLKPRKQRNPETYEEEASPEAGFMQRESDSSEPVEGVDAERMYTAWCGLKDTPYDLPKWNCSTLTRFLIITSMNPELYGSIVSGSEYKEEELASGATIQNVGDAIRAFAASHLVDCCPEDVQKLVQAINENIAKR
jgi:hypothetical protein